MATIIEIKNLTHRYGKLTAVNNISLQIQEGEIFGFIGPNGAGKSTTMRILSTLLRPTGGDAMEGGGRWARTRAMCGGSRAIRPIILGCITK